jgi:hypothetical protein
MTDRNSPRDETDPPRPKHGGRKGPRDPARVAENEATTSWSHGTESSYSAAARPKGRQAAQRHSDDAPLEVRIEFVQLDGPAGQALRRRQAQIMRKVLRWIADHPDPANQ